jgi:hypothetical protein
MKYRTSEDYFKDHPEERTKIKKYKMGESGITDEMDQVLFEPFVETEYMAIKSNSKNMGWVSKR